MAEGDKFGNDLNNPASRYYNFSIDVQTTFAEDHGQFLVGEVHVEAGSMDSFPGWKLF